MTSHRFVRSLMLTLSVVGGILAIWLVPRGAAQPTSHFDSMLRQMGAAYGKDHAIVLKGLQTKVAGVVKPTDQSRWSTMMDSRLAVGYSPVAGKLQTISVKSLGEIARIKMGGGHTTQEALRGAIGPGDVVVEVSWDFGGPTLVNSVALFGPDGSPLFDTLLSMPVIHGNVFSPSHF